MSWLSIPLPNPFKSLQLSNNDDEEEDEPHNEVVPSAIGEAIGRQFRAFISPETSNSGDGGSPSSRTFEEFDMSEAQYEHASVIEQLVPSLADLRSNISSEKSEIKFLLQIVEARSTLLKMLQAKKSEINSENPQSDSSYDSDNEVRNTPLNNSQSSKDVMSSEISTASRSVKGDKSNNTMMLLKAEDESRVTCDDPNQPEANPEHEKFNKCEYEQHADPPTKSVAAQKQIQSEDDISFSDLDDDDNDLLSRQSNSGPSQVKTTSSPEGSNDWVRLNKNAGFGGSKVNSQSSLRERDSEGEDSTGWLTVDDCGP
ncbi:Sorting nexin-4 [Bienertia sinuspersici]